ncbi:MAG: hypothetical protein HXY34_06770 [Candidatus Thorarchaeota archaeon]|nr:hypothetical protein [Candidatus Thorarchaeota archaeon]
MSRRLVLAVLVFAVLTGLLMQGLGDASGKDPVIARDGFVPASEGPLVGVPYVWQEINGFCNWAATSVLLQYEGIPLSMHDLFAAAGVGFSTAYIRYNDTMLLYPGALYSQIYPVDFVCRVYGLNYSVYFSAEVEGIEEQIEVLRHRGIYAGLLNGQTDAFSLMRSAIDSGHGLLISVDPLWLPASDYDYLRNLGISGGGHAVVIVGYNDTAGKATIIDPGVGSFGMNFGYPYDGRGNYTEIAYTSLNTAWFNRYYISILIKKQTVPSAQPGELLGPYMRDMLLGVGTVYAPDSPSAYLWKFGYSAYRELANDLTSAGLKEYLQVFDGMPDEVKFKASLLFFIGIGVESQVSLQYLAYRSCLNSVPTLLTGRNTTAFIAAANKALPHFAAVSSNSSLIHPGNLSVVDGPIISLFRTLASVYNTTGDLDGALIQYSNQLSELNSHLSCIAESWREAGLCLAEIWPSDPLVVYGPLLVVAGAAVGVVVVVVIIYIIRKPSQ